MRQELNTRMRNSEGCMKHEETEKTKQNPDRTKPRNPTVFHTQGVAPEIPRKELHPTLVGAGRKQDGGHTRPKNQTKK